MNAGKSASCRELFKTLNICICIYLFISQLSNTGMYPMNVGKSINWLYSIWRHSPTILTAHIVIIIVRS